MAALVRAFNTFFRAGQEMPARGRLRPAKMLQRADLFLRGHVRRFARIETHEDHFVIAPGVNDNMLSAPTTPCSTWLQSIGQP